MTEMIVPIQSGEIRKGTAPLLEIGQFAGFDNCRVGPFQFRFQGGELLRVELVLERQVGEKVVELLSGAIVARHQRLDLEHLKGGVLIVGKDHALFFDLEHLPIGIASWSVSVRAACSSQSAE